MSTDDNDAYGDLDKSNLKFIYCQFLTTEKEVLREGTPSCKTSGCSSQFLVSLDDDLMLHYYT